MLAVNDREIELTGDDFKFIQWFMHKIVGIYLSDHKRAMVYGRLSRTMRKAGIARFADYRVRIEHDEQERIRFINTLTTNRTQFFREIHHFEYVADVLMNQWAGQGKKEVSLWSAGCSTGEEPYSFAIQLYMHQAWQQFQQVNILATDIDTQVLAHAREGIYTDDALASIPAEYLRPCFLKGKGTQKGKIKVAGHLREKIRFAPQNLMQSWNVPRNLDLISCRNVMIYFDKPTQAELIKRFHQWLRPGGVLFLGHSESVGPSEPLFHSLGQTIYVKR